MRLSRLEIRRLRRLAEVALLPGPGLNLLVGDNGAGKTSVLEAIHLLAYGRSFRGRVRDGLVASDAPALEVYAEWNEETGGGRRRKAGLRHAGQAWEGRLDGQPVASLGDLCAALRSEEHTSELQSLMRISYAVFCLKKKKTNETVTLTSKHMTTHK